MADDRFDALTRTAGKAVTRRQTLQGLFAVLGGALLTLVGGGRAYADPRRCISCTCGVGKPCNVKSTVPCTEISRGFGGNAACEEECAKRGQNRCSTGTAFHCPQGCRT